MTFLAWQAAWVKKMARTKKAIRVSKKAVGNALATGMTVRPSTYGAGALIVFIVAAGLSSLFI